ncbi:MAG: amidohydrolase [Chloroflexi bacterium]|nr:amidohydrolase [Chloroflexota bacterium]
MPGKYFIVDTEFHHIPIEAARLAAAGPKATAADLDFRNRMEKPGPAQELMFNAEAQLRHMDEVGIDMALIGVASWSLAGLEVCRIINDGLARLQKEYPGRFIPLAHVPYLEGQPAIDELDRAVTVLGLKGVTVLTSVRDVRLDDERLKPFFGEVARLGIPVMVHPTTRMPIWGGDKYNMSPGISREYEILKAFAECLLGVLPHYPELNFLFAHYGGGAPFLRAKLMSYFPPEDTTSIESGGRPRTIREFQDLGLEKRFNRLFDRMYLNLAGAGGWVPAVKQALLGVRPDRLCFATDYPFEMRRSADFRAYVSGIKRLDISERDKANILGGNARRLFRA